MALQFHNTLTRSVEPFTPLDPAGKKVKVYTCGPTVYNPAHLGNFRTFLFEDLLRRVLRMRGWAVEQVMNLTDVDDKIIKRAVERSLTITALTTQYRQIAWMRATSSQVSQPLKSTPHPLISVMAHASTGGRVTHPNSAQIADAHIAR